MKCEFKRMRIEPARSAGVKDRPIELSGRAQRAAQVTVALGPIADEFRATARMPRRLPRVARNC